MTLPADRSEVVVTDIQMPFTSMVVFMVKLGFASIPAFIILTIISFIAGGLLSGLFSGLVSG